MILQRIVGIAIVFIFTSKNLLSKGDTLLLTNFLDVVIEYHPLIKKADLFNEIVEAYKLKGKGVLDPKLNGGHNNKNFKEANYFRTWASEVKLPTRLPVDFQLGYENNNGAFLNPEKSVPNNGLFYGSLNISILRGLLFDQQRYHIKEAQLNEVKSKIDRELLIREVIIQSVNTFVDWSAAYSKLLLNELYFNTVQETHNNIIQLVINGDKPSIDTIESRINLLDASKNVVKAKNDLVKSRQKLSLFIWDNNGQPLSIREEIVPQEINILVDQINQLNQNIEYNFSLDPSIRKLDLSIAELELKNKLERENFKPQLDLKYNTIVNLGENNLNPSFSSNDYKYGLQFSLPILNRKTKANIRLNKAKMDQTNFEILQHSEKLKLTYEYLIQSLELQKQAINISETKIINGETLLQAENLKFDMGESSLFLLIQRQVKLLMSQMEFVEALNKFGKINSEMYYLTLGQRPLIN